MVAKKIRSEDLVIHVLNVGFGDNIIIEFPVDNNGRRSFGVVDCYKGKKTKDYLDALVPNAPDRLRSTMSITVSSRSSTYFLMKGWPMRAVTFQSMARTSSPS